MGQAGFVKILTPAVLLDECSNAGLVERQRQRILVDFIEALAEQPGIPESIGGGINSSNGCLLYAETYHIMLLSCNTSSFQSETTFSPRNSWVILAHRVMLSIEAK
jgi:hypothetical protein